MISFRDLDGWRRAGVLALQLPGFPVAEEHQAVGLRGPEVERDGARLLGRPLAQCHVGLGRVEGHGVQGGHTLALEGHHPAHLGPREGTRTVLRSKFLTSGYLIWEFIVYLLVFFLCVCLTRHHCE